MTPVIAIIGGGNMGHSLVAGLIKHGHPANTIWVSDPSLDKLETLKKLNIHVTQDNSEALKNSNVLIFAVKPQLFAEVAKPLADGIRKKKPLVISIAAGIPTKSIEHWLQNSVSIVRAMPNAGASVGLSATALYANQNVTTEEHKLAESILGALGIVTWITDESLMNTVTALSGSGPAYFFLMMEVLQKVGEELGLSAEISHYLTLQTALGAATLAIQSQESLKILREKVTSPGGTTEKAISVLEKNHLDRIFLEAIKAAKERSEEIALSFGD